MRQARLDRAYLPLDKGAPLKTPKAANLRRVGTHQHWAGLPGRQASLHCQQGCSRLFTAAPGLVFIPDLVQPGTLYISIFSDNKKPGGVTNSVRVCLKGIPKSN